MDIKKVLKLNGLMLAPDASAYLNTTLAASATSADVVKRFVDCVLANPGLESNRVTKSLCEEILSTWQSESESSEEILFLINALDIPHFKYCRNTQKFVPLRTQAKSNEASSHLLPYSPLPKSFLYANRYEVVYQRVVRNPLFADETGFKLCPIEYLLSSGAKATSGKAEDDDESRHEKPQNVIVLGVLVQLKNAQWYLEDPTNLVRLDLSQTRFHQGIFAEGSVVLAEGWYDDDVEVFNATGIGLPPAERPTETRRYFSVTNPFGGGAGLEAPAAADDQRMTRLLNASPDSMLVLLGETRLDIPGCLEHLDTIFTGYAEFPPCAFVLCGDFVSPDYSIHASEKHSLLKQLFRRLVDNFLRVYADSEERGYRQPRLILVPGPHDPCVGPQGIYPRPALPLNLFGETTASNWLWLATNPCRLRVYSRELVVFRYDYAKHLVRHCIHFPCVSSVPPNDAAEATSCDLDAESQTQYNPDEEADETFTDMETQASSKDVPATILGRALARCLTSQAHLTPLPLHVSPVYWSFDQSLSLNPLPDLVVAVEPDAVADLNIASKSIVPPGGEDPLCGCRFINPGRFGGRMGYEFKVYYPSTKMVEDSRLPV